MSECKILQLYGWVEKDFQLVRVRQGGKFVDCKCPFKDHSHAVVSFWLGKRDQLMFKCWAGCEKTEILRAVGRKWTDCFIDHEDFKHLQSTVVARYKYRSENGGILYVKERIEPGPNGKDKTFVIKRPGPNGWINGIGDARRVLYNNQIIKHAEDGCYVFVVGGEKDCETISKSGMLSTCNVGGETEAWREEYSEALKRFNVCIIPDKDQTGKAHAAKVAGSLIMAGVQSVRIIDIPAKDITELINNMRKQTIVNEEDIAMLLYEYILKTPAWRPFYE